MIVAPSSCRSGPHESTSLISHLGFFARPFLARGFLRAAGFLATGLLVDGHSAWTSS